MKRKLEHYLINVLRNEIIIADKSYYILQTINKHWDQISIDGYDLFFKSTYSAYFIKYSLALTKLFEIPIKNHNTISVPSVIDFIHENINYFSIQNRSYLNPQFSQLGYDYKMINSLSDADLKGNMIKHFKVQLTSTNNSWDLNLSRTLEIIKKYRDKHYTHNDDIDLSTLPKTTFEEANNLLLFAKQFVNIFALAFLNMVQFYDGKEYKFNRIAKRTNNSFKRLLEKANLIPQKTFEH